MSNPCGRGRGVLRAPAVLIRRLGLAAMLLLAAPIGVAASTAAAPASTAAPAQVAAKLAAAHLPEPLMAIGPTTPAEDAALLAAVTRYQDRADPDDFAALTGFLAGYPYSAWRVAVSTNLGIVYLHYGYFSRALAAYETAWHEGKDATNPRARALVDRALGELLALDADFGYRQRLAALLTEIGTRPVSGSAAAMLREAQQTLWVMKTDPKHFYLCGPMALKMLLLAQHSTLAQVDFLNWVRADGPQGTNLVEVAALAERVNVSLLPVFRKSGEPVPVPSIVHWRIGHFAALVGERDGRFEVKDPTFGHQSLWVTQEALDAEASGYFLVSAKVAAAGGLRRVAAAEAGHIWGAGFTPNLGSNPKNKNPCSSCTCAGMCGYGINAHDVSLDLNDRPVGYAPPKGPSAVVMLAYDALDQSQPANFNFFNVSQNWTVNWLSYVEDDPTTPGSQVTDYLRDGTLYSYTGYDSSTRSFAPQEDDASVLVLKTTSPVAYQRRLQDGTIETYAESDGSAVFPRNIFLSKITDPRGNTLTLHYDKVDGRVRLVSLTDATGRKTSFSYRSRVSPLLVTRITDPFGRSASLTYDGDGRLNSITDVLGLTSKFTYDSSSSEIIALTTPYGTTRFVYGGSGNRFFMNAVDPLGYGERQETFQPAPVPDSEPSADVPQGMVGLANGNLIYRDSFHWSKHQYAVGGCTPNGGCNYADASVLHFTHDANNVNLEWDTIESRKEPLENRVWYTYEGQSGGFFSGTYDLPNAIGRVLDNGQTQLTQFAYNGFGNPTEMVDPVGRTTSFTYAANLIDAVSIAQTTAGGPRTVAEFSYNGQHEPLTSTDAAGRTTHYAYNTAGQLTSLTNPLGQETRYVYDATGDLTTIIDADGKTTASFTYDSFDRVKTYTDSQGWTVSYGYDAANRLTQATYLDSTTEVYTYDKLDLASYRDRQGHLWHYVHDADRRLTSATDALGHVTTYTYFEDGALKSLTDPNGHTTNWAVDVESRPTAKIYADGSETTYQYEITTSRLKSTTDALGQSKDYSYALDDQLAGITYDSTLNPTPNVGFTYDPFFPRVTSMIDGSGTTNYSYVPIGALGALHLAQEAGPLPDGRIDYAYDALGRVVARNVGGASPETFRYDTIGRLVGHADALGNFDLAYLGETGQLTKRALAGGNVATAWSYLSNTGDRRLKSIVNTPGREFDYTTTPDALISKIMEQKSGNLQRTWNLGYDDDNRLLTATSSPGAKYAYRLDPAGNIIKSGATTLTYNKVNELTNAGYIYDADGELVSDGVRSYAWDGEHRLVGVTEAGSRSGFAYDGLNRRVVIRATAAGKTTTADYIWCGARLCQSRNRASSAARLYYAEGEVLAPQSEKLYYGPDQLGSVRDMDVISATVSAPGQAYDYDPYGNPTATPAGVPLTDFRYAGMFYPGNGTAEGGLDLTQYRAYDPRIARWLSRDPLGEVAGFNLFSYADDDPIDKLDRFGLWTVQLGVGGSGSTGPLLGPLGLAIWGGFGVTWDLCGHVGFFWTLGGGLSLGSISQGFGGLFDVTNAHTINDLNGLSGNVNIRTGPVNWNGSISNYSNGQHYYGGSVIVGEGTGVAGAIGGSYTGITPLFSF